MVATVFKVVALVLVEVVVAHTSVGSNARFVYRR
jgi:hypothetical protein